MIAELRAQVKNQDFNNDFKAQGQSAESQLQMRSADARTEALTYQMQQQAVDHAREVNQLKRQIMERDSLVDTIKYAGVTNGEQYY